MKIEIKNKPLIMNLQLFSELGEEDTIELDTTDFEETSDIPTDGQDVEDNTTTEPTQTEEVQPFLNIKYNKEDMALTQEQAIELAQKGMNYDKIMDKLHQAENNVGMQYLNELAQRNGATIEELVNYWRVQEEQAQLNQLIQNNIPEEYAKEILENRKFREEQQRLQRENAAKERQNLEFNEFFNAFPNVKPEEIPNSVWEANNNGIPLKFAYMQYENQQLLNKINILENNQANKNKAPIGTGIGNTSNDDYDSFLDGFDNY